MVNSRRLIDNWVFLEGNRLIVEPLRSDDDFFDFTAEIQADLKKRAYSGQALLDEVNRRKQQIDTALAEMVQEALEEYRRGESLSRDEVFMLEDAR